jgi:twitching motility protein PilT
MARIDAFLKLGRAQGGSDIHLTVGLPPLVRVDGDLAPIKFRELSADETRSMIGEILDDKQREEFQDKGSIDFSYMSEEAGRFRMNVCRQSKGLAAVARIIPESVMALQNLGLPPVITDLTSLNQGLVLVTGATGTGKSTTLAAIIDAINASRNSAIITLEDPVEVIHRCKKGQVVQRELGVHVRSFGEGLRAALRQDPDVILVGELRDHETISLAMEASETGHLVLGTLHTRSAAATIDRILDAFPGEQHNQVRSTLADTLKCVVSQELLRAADGRGRRAVVEILVNNAAVSQLIREGKTFQIPSAITTGRRFGMQHMDDHLLSLVKAGDIDPDQAFTVATNKADFVPFVSNPNAAALVVGARGE